MKQKEVILFNKGSWPSWLTVKLLSERSAWYQKYGQLSDIKCLKDMLSKLEHFAYDLIISGHLDCSAGPGFAKLDLYKIDLFNQSQSPILFYLFY